MHQYNPNINREINRPIVKLEQEATLHITEQFLAQIKYLCNKISEVEWSGIVFYKTEGDANQLANFKVIPYYIHLMDRGSGTYTEFDDDGSMKELYEAMPELDPFSGNAYKYGKIHSHNSMAVFHSGTDMQDLQDQSGAYDYFYLSVIVNNALDIEAKASFVAKLPGRTIEAQGTVAISLQEPEKEVLAVIDFNVESEVEFVVVSDILKARTEAVIEADKAPTYGGYGRTHHIGSNGTTHMSDFEVHRGAGIKPASADADLKMNLGYRAFIQKTKAYLGTKTVDAEEILAELEDMDESLVEKAVPSYIKWYGKCSDYMQECVLEYISQTDYESENFDIITEGMWESITIKGW